MAAPTDGNDIPSAVEDEKEVLDSRAATTTTTATTTEGATTDGTTGGETTTSGGEATTGETTTGETTDGTTTTTTKKKKKKKKKKKRGKKGKKKRKGKKKKKAKRSKSNSKSSRKLDVPETPKYTEEDIASYVEKKEKYKEKVKEQRLVTRMKELVSIVRLNDPRWTAWTEAPLQKFITDPDTDVITIFFSTVEHKTEGNKILWGDEEETTAKGDATESENPEGEENTENQDVSDLTVDSPAQETGGPAKLETDPIKRYDSLIEEKPLGPPPPAIEGEEQLMVTNEVVANRSPDIFYFVKTKRTKLSNQNFFEDCVFGNVPGGHLGSLQNLLSYIYGPIFYQNGVLPDSVKNDFSAAINKLMSTLTETHHRVLNQTVLYVPKEVLDMPIDVASRDKELCARLEDVMIHWIRQIKELLSDQGFLDSDDWSGPLDELLFWETRNVDLAGLTQQIRSHNVRLVRDIMQIIKSPYVAQFNEVADQILEGSEEAISNLHYLNILREPCDKLQESTVKEIPDQLQNILWLIRVIWLNAPYYNSRQKLNGLVRRVSNVIIKKCKDTIDVSKAFNGFIVSSEVALHDCEACLAAWKKKYFEAQKMHSMNSNTNWLLEYDMIFTHVDAFMQRIRDILEICVCQRLYGRRVEGTQEDLPLYPGTRAPEITKVMTEVQKLFDRPLRILSNHSHLILEVKNALWHEHMIKFKSAVKDLEMMVQNVLMSTFDSLSNIEACCQLLETFYYYRFYQRDIIVRAYDKLTVKLYKLFENETLRVKDIYAKKLLPLPLVFPQFAGRGAWALYMKRRIDMNYELLRKAWWLPECGLGDDVVAQHKVLSQNLVDFANEMYNNWVKELGPKDLTDKLSIPLMARSTFRPGMIEVNFDKLIHRHITEAEIWTRLGREVPPVLATAFSERLRLHNLQETVLLVVKDYNRIVAALSTEERSLFKERIKLLDRKIYPGMHKLTWLSNVSDAYINDCRMAANKVQGFTNDYKLANIKIGKLATKISQYLMVRVDPTRVFNKLEFNDFQTKHREKAILMIARNYKEVTLIIRSVFEMFRADGAEVKAQWIKYLETVDDVIKEALCINIRRSLEVLRGAVHGAKTRGPPPPIFKIDVVLNKSRLEFSPSLSTIKDMLMGIYGKICYIMKSFPRVVHFLNDPNSKIATFSHIMASDPEAQATQKIIGDAVADCLSHVRKYRSSWDMYRDVWEVNKDLFMERYEKLNPPVHAFDNDITRYGEVVNAIQEQENILTIDFCVLNCSQLKVAIADHCRVWQERLCTLLYEIASNKIISLQHYMADNIKKFVKPPETIPEMIAVFKKFRNVVAEIPVKEKEFPAMFEKFECLKKHEYELGDYTKSRVANFSHEWHRYQQKLKEIGVMLKAAKERLEKIFIAMGETFRQKVHDLVVHFENHGPYAGDVTSDDAIDRLADYRSTMEELKLEEHELLLALAVFDIDIPSNMELKNFEKDLAVVESVWEVVYEWDYNWEEYKIEPFRTMQTGDMEDVASYILKKLVKLSVEHEKKRWDIIDFTKNRVEVFKRSIPVIHEIKSPALRERHWNQIFETIGATFDPEDDNFTFDVIVSYGMERFADEIAEIVSTAQKELIVENTLKAIREIWVGQKLDMVPYKEKGHYRLKSVQDLMQNLEDHNVSISAMKGSRYAKPFEDELHYWEKTLIMINDVLELFLNVQRQYIYLENIFTGEDIRKQLPRETKHFDEINDCWKDVTHNMYSDSLAIPVTHRAGLIPILRDLLERLEMILKSLEIFLEAKRQAFPRFYFISNDDLLEILGNSRSPEMVQPHLKKLFDNIHKIKLVKVAHLTKFECQGMQSGDGEYVDFIKPFLIDGPVEVWLTLVEASMRIAVKEALIATRANLRKNLNRRDKWIKEYPGQPGITSAQIQWTTTVTRALYLAEIHHVKNPLKKVKKKLNKILNKYSIAIRGNLPKIQRLKIVAMVTIEIHNRDVVDKMYKSNCRDMNAFEWLQQLRFYWEKDIMDCMARQTNTFFVYGYEYLGNSGRLVVTPLTDRCYITLTTALFLHRGGSPKGPAGTGKTETTKDLGKGLGIFVIVVNCSEGLDYKSMGKMFSGLSQTGCWGCFDEFNRINIEVLSVVAQQIMCILQALSNNQKRFFFEGYDIRLIWSVGIFITMNPGYAGRTELPDNLKAMFRPIAMIVPDTNLIAEIVLFGEGFRDTRVLARKVDTLYSLAKQQLSKQDHYDFGLRSMVALLRYAGQVRRKSQTMTDSEVLILAMRDMNIPRLTTDDVPLFTGVIRDLFPNDEPPIFDYGVLIQGIQNELVRSGYQPTPKAILKCLELYNTKNSRHSVMIVGRTGSGKSVTWRVLRDSMTSLAKEGEAGFVTVKEHIINPKAVDLSQLYGEFDLSTSEWSDGIISSIMRITCNDERPDQKWLVFDGPVDAVWIESMNSVMDDNKILTLINSERIAMPEQVSLLFEVDNLAVASPATVSRCGMVYTDYKDLGWKSYIESWLGRQKRTKTAEEYRKNIDQYLEITLQFKSGNCKEIVAATELNLCASLARMMDSLATKENGCNPKEEGTFEVMVRYYFMFSLIWSVGVAVDEDGRKKMDGYLRELDPLFPAKDTIYDYYVDPKAKTFVHWETQLASNWKYDEELPFFKIVVPTVDTVRYNYVLSNLLKNSHPVCVIGPVGTGKTSVVQSALRSLDPEIYTILTINMSSQTTSTNVQNFIESRLERRAKGVFAPAGGKNLLTFLDDLNMPAKDTYGSQPPLELVRQWLDYKFWYDRQTQAAKLISNMFLVAAMGPPGGGRTVISPRLQNIFSIIYMTFPEESQIKRIFCTMLTQKLAQFDPEVKVIAEPVTMACIDLYHSVADKMLPTPNKTHYLFNLRDISRVFQGLLRSHKEYQGSKIAFEKLWFHECCRVFHDRLVDEPDREWLLGCLAEKLGTYLDQTVQSICPNRVVPVFGDFLNTARQYEDMRDFKAIRAFMVESALPAYNSLPGCIPMKLVLFKDAIEHVTRIARVVSQPKGNIMVVGIGGHGRQSLSKLASFICDFSTFEIEVNKRYRKPEFREDIKKIYRRTGVENKSCCFIMNDTQIVDEGFLEDINNILSSGEVPNLYKAEEFEEVKNTIMKSALRAGYTEANDSVFKFLLDRVQSNLHLVLCMSPIGDSFRHRVRQYPALVNCTTIDWFDRWPKEALLEVAHRYLSDVVLDDRSPFLQDEMRTNCATMFATIHFMVTDYCKIMLEELKRHNYVTPINYLELVTGYKILLAEKRREIGEAANRLKTGLHKIIETRVKVEEMKADLEISQQRVIEYQGICDQFLEQIIKRTTETDIQAVIVAQKRERVAIEEKECKELAKVAYAELAAALPALNEAIAALKALNKADLAEVKSYSKPPTIVGKVMEAVMVLLQVDPTWTEAKKQLGNPEFLKELIEFDRDHISEKTIAKLQKYLKYEGFIPDLVGKVSFAAKSLCIWVRAMELYGKIYNKQVAPKKAKLEEAELFLKEKQRILAEAEAKIRELEEILAKLKREHEEKLAEKDALARKAEELLRKLQRAAMLVDGLSGERVRWEETIKSLAQKMSTVVGDCLLAAGCISYIGPFLSNYREEMVSNWIKSTRSLSIPCASDYNFCDFLSWPTTVRMWNIQGLPRDAFSTENGVIVTRGRRTPLMIDPQTQALKWIKNMESANELKLIDLRSANYMTVLEECIVNGSPVLLKDVGEELDHALGPVLSRSVVKQGDRLVMKFADKELDYNIDFRFYITTKMSNPHYVPEIASRACIVNFAVKEQGLEAQLLGIVVRKERPELEDMKNTLVVNIAAGKKKLEELEDTILRLLNESKGSILDDEELAITLKTSKETSIAVTKQVETAQQTEIEIDAARENYRASATRASILFFVLYDMSQIDPMYQFSLDSYISLFNISIEKSPGSHGLDDRITNLNDYHTYAVYRNICRALFEKHKLLFSLHMCVKIMENSGRLNIEEYQYFLKGGVVLDRSEQMENPCAQWLSEVAWDNIVELEKLSGFRGIVTSFEQHSKDWNTWYTSAEPEKDFLPGDWESRFNDFQKMVVVRALRPDRVSLRAAAFVATNLGVRFTEPPVLDMGSVLEDSTSLTPLIFVLSSGADPAASLFTLAETNKMMHRFFSLSLGQGQAPFATRMIQEGAKMGHWVFLANCHLSLSWMPDLDRLVETICDETPHKDFRLWLSSSPHPDFPLSILQAGIKMTTEPPKGIKANMKRLYHGISENRFVNQLKPEKFKKLLFGLCFFHAILLERKKFQQLGWNIVYPFNDSDFEVSELLLGIYLGEYEETPWDALKYLIAGVMYGGHVTDDWDRRLLYSYINQYFCEGAIQTPFFRLSELPNYYIPKDGDVKHYRDVVNKLPASDHPEAFGQHTNADIASQINEANMLFTTLLSLQVQKQASQTIGKAEDKVAQMAAEVMAKLPNTINEADLRKVMGAHINQPMNIVLLQEISRYNVLLESIQRSLIELDKGIQGLVVMSAELEDIFKCINDGLVPTQWLKAYPSLKLLGAWSRDLSRRVDQLALWTNTLKPPVKFWLSGLTFPSGFLTAVLQTTARVHNISIDTLSWEFSVSSIDANNILLPPKDGVYVQGLFLEGASWDKKASALCESAPMQLVTQMPVIHFKPVQNKKKSHKNLYDAPCYYYPERSGGQGRPSYVVTVELRGGAETVDHWTQRGVALLMSLAT